MRYAYILYIFLCDDFCKNGEAGGVRVWREMQSAYKMYISLYFTFFCFTQIIIESL